MAAVARPLPPSTASRAPAPIQTLPRSSAGQWTAIVLAGQRPGVDPLASAYAQTYKALVEVDGEPMLRRVLRTLLAHPRIGRICVLAQEPEALLQAAEAGLERRKRIDAVVSGPGIARSIQAVVQSEGAWPYLITTADHPLLTGGMIDEFLGAAGDSDVAVGMVSRRTVLARYPDTRRTWLRFSDDGYSGANLFAFGDRRAAAALDLWARAEADRKSAFKLFLHFGLPLALRAITRTIDLAGALHRAGERFGIRASAVLLSDPDAAIDVDKPHDLQLAEAILRARDPLPGARDREAERARA